VNLYFRERRTNNIVTIFYVKLVRHESSFCKIDIVQYMLTKHIIDI